jgi:hypothetical protein
VKRAEEEAREVEEWAEKERAFVRANPGAEKQRQVIVEYCAGMPFSLDGTAARVLAIGRWWQLFSGSERVELPR